MLERAFAGSPFDVSGVRRTALLAAGRELIAERPRTRAELGALLARRWPRSDPASLAQAVTYLVPVVQVTPRGVWGQNGQPRWTTSDEWLGRAVAAKPAPELVVSRYLAAFGPATIKDIQTWSGLTRLAGVLDSLRPSLRTFRGEHGAELFDLPDAPRPDPDTPAPPRFLPEYDNLLLSHADRSRVIPGRERVPLQPGLGARSGTLLADGFFRGTWRVARHRDRAVLHIEPFGSLPDRDGFAAEGEALLRFAFADASDHDISFDH